jgi:hypothetical protein
VRGCALDHLVPFSCKGRGFCPSCGGRLSARDAVHLAIMERHGVRRIMSFDSGFDGFPGVERLS